MLVDDDGTWALFPLFGIYHGIVLMPSDDDDDDDQPSSQSQSSPLVLVLVDVDGASQLKDQISSSSFDDAASSCCKLHLIGGPAIMLFKGS